MMKINYLIISVMILGSAICVASEKNENDNTVTTASQEKIINQPKAADVASIYKGVVDVKVELGESVKKGQVLFNVNTDMLNAQKKYNENYFKFTKLCVDRAKKLVENHSISLDDYQQCIRDLNVAKEQLANTMAQIEYSTYKAPFDGTVTQIVRYSGSGLGDNDNEVQVTEGKVNVNTKNRVGLVCNRWPGVLELKVKEGDLVKKGQLLFKIKTDAIEAKIKEDKALYEYGKMLYQRNEKLFKTNNVSLYDYYKSKVDQDMALMTLEQDQIMLKQASTYAPFDGTITKIFRYSDSGNGAGKPVLSITAVMK